MDCMWCLPSLSLGLMSRRFRGSTSKRRILKGVAIFFAVITLAAMWVLYEAHIRVIRSGAVDGSATPKYHYIPNSGVIRVESEYDSPNTAPSLKEILPPSESVPHTSVTYLRGLLTKIPAPALMGASAATADACLADMWNALDGPQGEGGSGLGSSEVYAIVVAVEGTWGSPLELNVGYIWRRSEQDHWRVRRGPRPAAGMFKNAGWYCLTVMVASLRNTTLGARDSQKVLSTSFVITDPHSDHSHSELGVTPISLKEYPHWPPSLSAALLTLRPVAVVDGADTPMLIFDTDKSARLKSVEGIIETLITAVPPSHDDGSMVATYSTKNGSSMLEVLHREARQCFDPTRDGSGACVPVFGGWLWVGRLKLYEVSFDAVCPSAVSLYLCRFRTSKAHPRYHRLRS